AATHGLEGALPALRQQGLLPPGLVIAVGVADRDGNIVASNPHIARFNVSSQDFFRVQREAGADQPFVSQPVTHDARSDPRLHFTRRIVDAQGRFAGVAIVAVDPAYFTSAYERSREG